MAEVEPALSEDVSSMSTPAFATLSAIVTYAVVSAHGEPVNTMQNQAHLGDSEKRNAFEDKAH